jgi:hypothetical protein
MDLRTKKYPLKERSREKKQSIKILKHAELGLIL